VRIGIIAPPWLPVPPPGYGGTEVVVDHLARGVQTAGHEVLLCSTADSTAVPTARGNVEAIGTGQFALFLGRMNPDKGADRAIRIAKGAGVPLKIASKMQEPEEEAYFHEAVEPLLGGNVEFLGEVDGAAKDDLLSDALCLLNPVDWPEPFGMVMAEALAHGTPVLAMPCGSVPELIDDGVTGFIRETERELSEALLEVSSLDRTVCRAAAVERFSTGRMVDDHLALYRSVVTTDARAS
jgi:glycosyltransferase involved in cell wall biosynthesis